MLEIGTDFSGVGAFEQALKNKNIQHKTVFACDSDKFARTTYLANNPPPEDYPEDVYERKIPEKSLDIYVTTPPCQSFSLAGRRKGEEDKRGILFYNSHEFILKNKPRFFIFENVKGLISDDKGKTFGRWIDMLAGKSVNGSPVIFPREDSTPYHVYHKIIDAKKQGVPQSRERIFIIGVRDDSDNKFFWPKEEFLTKRIKDILEKDVSKKYFLSDKAVKRLTNDGKGFSSVIKTKDDIASTICAGDYKLARGMNILRVDDPETEIQISAIRGRHSEITKKLGLPMDQTLEINKNGIANALTTVQTDNVVVFGNLRGGKWERQFEQSRRVYDINGVSPTLHTMSGGGQHPKIYNENKIRKFTPRECFRLMAFPDSFIMPCSDSQMYKQAGNSVVVKVYEDIIERIMNIINDNKYKLYSFP